MRVQELDIEPIVRDSCSELIQLGFYVKKKNYATVFLLSDKCGIKIVAAETPIGEYQIEEDFFDPREPEESRKYYSAFGLQHNILRNEQMPIDANEEIIYSSFKDIVYAYLKSFTAHTIKYRQDILSGDFTSWLPKKLLE